MPKRKETATVETKVRMREALRADLESAAKANRASMNAEIVRRLQRSFDEARVLGGRKVQAIVNMMAATFAHSGQMYARADGKPNWETDAWVDDEFCYNEAMMSTIEALVSGMPGGTPTENEVKDVLTRAFNRIKSDMINSGKWENPFRFEGDDNG